MRDEIAAVQRGIEKETYFVKIRNLTAMLHNNQDIVFKEYPRFQNVLYEYLSMRGMHNELKLFTLLEDYIVYKNLHNLPIPVIKNFIKAMSKLGRGRKEIVSVLKQYLDDKNVYKDLKSNLPICAALSNICMLSNGENNDYLHKSLESIQKEIISQNAKGISFIGETNKTKSLDTFAISNVTFKATFHFCVKSLSSLNLKFTEEELEKVYSSLKFIKMGNTELPIIEDQILNLKELIILSIFQYSHIYKNEIADYSELIELKYICKSFPEITKYCQELILRLSNSEKDFKDKTNKFDSKVIYDRTELRIANIFDELGIFYHFNYRIEDVFLAQFFLPKINTIFEHLHIIDFVKTDDTKNEKVLGGRYLIRKKIFEAYGYNVVNVDSFDFMNLDNNNSKIVDIIKEKLKILN